MANAKHRLARAIPAIALMSLSCASAWAQSASPANAKLTQCFTCHGQDGIAKVPDAPNLAGQNETYLVHALNEYKSGARKHEVMSMMAKPLSEEDIAQAASYFSGIRIEVKGR